MSMTPQSDNEAAAPVERGRFLGRRHSLQTPSEALEPVSAPPPPPAPPSKRRPGLSALSGFLSFLLVVAICAAGGVGYAERELREPGPLTSDKVVMIAPRTEVFEIISQLESEGVIDSPALLNAALIVRGDRSRVKAGEYLFKQHASLRDVIDTLVSGREILHSITLPEGLTSEQIVARLMDNDVLVGDVRETPKEGSLLPDTYRVARGMQRADLIRKMQDAQKKLLAQIWARALARSPAALSLRTRHVGLHRRERDRQGRRAAARRRRVSEPARQAHAAAVGFRRSSTESSAAKARSADRS